MSINFGAKKDKDHKHTCELSSAYQEQNLHDLSKDDDFVYIGAKVSKLMKQLHWSTQRMHGQVVECS